ncbi:10473_t:CDS:2, partial [Acaulospora morrowiae]
MSYLTREQLDKYLKNLSETAPKPANNNAGAIAINALQNATPRISTSINVPPPPKSHLAESTPKSERKQVLGPRPPPDTKRNRLSDSSKMQESNNSNTTVKRHSLSSLPRTSNNNADGSRNVSRKNSIPTAIEEKPKTSTFKTRDSNEKKRDVNIDEIVNDLSYPMETKLSLKPDNEGDNKTTKVFKNTKNVENNADDTSKGSYVLSAAFKSRISAPGASDQKQTMLPPSTQKRETTPAKEKRSSTIQESKQETQTNTNSNSRYDEAIQKYPPVDLLDNESSKIPSNNIRTEHDTNKEATPNKNLPLPDTDIQKSNDNTSQKSTNTSKPSSSINCAACEKQINGNVLSALGKKWHPEHFTCAHCNIALEHVSFYEKDGRPYCHLDYHELFSPRCGSCNTPIEGKCINALGKYWHPGHFFCRECGKPFESGGFMVHDGFPYCEDDWTRLFASKCKGCQQPIKGEHTSALDGLWHNHCFCCE